MLKSKSPLINFLILVIFIFSFYFVIATSFNVRYWADDFCSSVLLRNNGYFKSQIIWWKSWTGRYSYIAALDFFELFGVWGAKILPLINYFLLSISSPVGLLYPILFLGNSTNLIQNFYWMTGSLNYFAPFIFLNFLFILLFKKFKSKFIYLSFLIMFIASGFSESFSLASLLLFLFVGTVIYLSNLKDKKDKYLLLITGFFGSLVSLILMYLAPGNLARSATLSHPESFLIWVKDTLLYSRWYLIHLFYIKNFVYSLILIFLSPLLFLKKEKTFFKKPVLILILYMIFSILFVLVVVGITYYATNFEPAQRVMSIAVNMIIISAIITSFAIKDVLADKVNIKLVKLFFVAILILFAGQFFSNLNQVKNEITDYANSWDKQVQILKSSDSSVVKLENIKSVGKLDGFVENKGWVKSCITSYYNLEEIIVKE